MSRRKFNEEECAIPRVWCGEAKTYPKGIKDDGYYYKVGSRYECLKAGIGVGLATEKSKAAPATSLQRIKYVGEKHAESFKKAGIKTLKDLTREMGKKTSTQIATTLKKILKKKNGPLDTRAYNSTVLYLYRHGVAGVPACIKM